jgi:hypothetical protein
MRYPTEAELIEMERRAELLIKHAVKVRGEGKLHRADMYDRIAEDFAVLVAILRIYRLGRVA